MENWLENILTSNITWAVCAIIIGYIYALLLAPIYVWLERRGAAMIQMRPGPNRRGPYGIIQLIADAVKLALKEDIVPAGANKWLHGFAPMVGVIVALSTFAVIPWSLDFQISGQTFRLQAADINFGIIYILAISSLGVYSGVIAGWSSNNKYSMMGGLRAGAQVISYEIAMGLAVVCVILVYDSVLLSDMVVAQSGAVWNWGIFKAPLAFFIYIIAMYAETNRTPFDLVEADSELVAGYFTEYSSFKFTLFFMGEYMHMAISALLLVVLFFGGSQIPWASNANGDYAAIFPFVMSGAVVIFSILAWDVKRPKRNVHTHGNTIFSIICIFAALAAAIVGICFVAFDVQSNIEWMASLAGVVTQLVVLTVKFAFFFWLFIWVRWTVPRFRYDQLMKLGWKVLIPLALVNLAVTSVLIISGWL